jgi:hypothetical protein
MALAFPLFMISQSHSSTIIKGMYYPPWMSFQWINRMEIWGWYKNCEAILIRF